MTTFRTGTLSRRQAIGEPIEHRCASHSPRHMLVADKLRILIRLLHYHVTLFCLDSEQIADALREVRELLSVRPAGSLALRANERLLL